MRTSDSTTEIFDALVAANEDLTNPLKTEEVQAGQKRYSFAPLPEIIDLVRPILRKHGLALIQEARTVEGYAGVGTRLVHSSGEWIEYEPLFMPSAPDAQSFGSVTTYARRYTLCAALGIAADEDDDAAKASKSEWPEKVDAARDADARRGNDATDRAVNPGSVDSQLAAASTEPGFIFALVEAYGTASKALVAARKAFNVTRLDVLTDEQARTLIGEAP